MFRHIRLAAVLTRTVMAERTEGWLNKQGEKGLVKSWKRRWFVLKVRYSFLTFKRASLIAALPLGTLVVFLRHYSS